VGPLLLGLSLEGVDEVWGDHPPHIQLHLAVVDGGDDGSFVDAHDRERVLIDIDDGASTLPWEGGYLVEKQGLLLLDLHDLPDLRQPPLPGLLLLSEAVDLEILWVSVDGQPLLVGSHQVPVD
jgi:hypothetical protein